MCICELEFSLDNILEYVLLTKIEHVVQKD